MKPPRLFLVGPPAAGKTWWGRRWAAELGCPFYDTDAEIERRSGLSIAEWFAQGEATFRSQEWAVLKALLKESAFGLYAVGGGFPGQPGAMDFLLSQGYCLWIDPPWSELRERLQAATDRPLLQGRSEEAWQTLIEARRPAYRKADLHWYTPWVPPAQVLKWVRQVLATWGVERVS